MSLRGLLPIAVVASAFAQTQPAFDAASVKPVNPGDCVIPGLTGAYKILLEWTPDDKSVTDSGLPSLVTAIQEQPGSGWNRQKGPVDIFVINHAEKLTEN